MRSKRLFVLTAVAAMSVSTIAHAGEIDSPREARTAINAMENENASLSKAIAAAEEKTGGTAFRVELASHDDVVETYALASRQSNQTTSNIDGKQSDSNNMNEKSIDRDAPHAKVQCLVDGRRIRCALVNLKSGEVVRVRNKGHSIASTGSYHDNRRGDYGRSNGYNNRDRYDGQRSRVDRDYIEQNAWPPTPGDRYYDEYADTRYDDDNRRDTGRYARYESDYGRVDNRNRDRYDNRFDRRPRYGSLDRFGSGLVLASDLMNANVRNNRDQDLGGIENLAIDPNSGCFVYATLTHGGFLGLGQKHFAIPPQELTLSGDGNIYLNVDRRELQNRDGFDAANWPMRADRSFSNTSMSYDHESSQKQSATAQRIVKASTIIDHDVVDGSGKELGEVDDLVVDPTRGKVAYLVVEVDDDLWEHDLVVVPMGAVQMNDDKCVVNIAKAKFQSMPTFSENDYPNWNNREWNRQTHARFNVTPYWNDDQS